MNKILFSAVISAILASGAFAADLLASLTNGKISDNSPGVKVLSLDEAKQVKGGQYDYAYLNISNGIAEFIVSIDETYDGKQLWLVGQKYGPTLKSGYSIFLAYRNGTKEPSKSYTNLGKQYNLTMVNKNYETSKILYNNHLDQMTNALNLSSIKPIYPR